MAFLLLSKCDTPGQLTIINAREEQRWHEADRHYRSNHSIASPVIRNFPELIIDLGYSHN